MRIPLCFLLLGLVQFATTCSVASDCEYGEICLNGICSECQENSECQQEQRCRDNRCVHKNLFESFNIFDFIIILVIFISSSLNAAVGIGGGTLYMPLLLLLFFQGEEAVTLSNAMTTAAALAQVSINFNSKLVIKKYKHSNSSPCISRENSNGNNKHESHHDDAEDQNHPNVENNHEIDPNGEHSHTQSKPLIDYNICLIVSPLSSGGTIIGSYLYRLFPGILLRIGLIIFLLFLNQKIAKKAYSEWKDYQTMKEEKSLFSLSHLETHQKKSALSEEKQPLLSEEDEEESKEEREELSILALEFMERESHIPAKKILIILFLFVILSIYNYSLKTSE